MERQPSGSLCRPELVGERPGAVGERAECAGCGEEHTGSADVGDSVGSEDQDHGRGADAGADREYTEHCEGDEHGGRIEHRGVDAAGVQHQPVACDLRGDGEGNEDRGVVLEALSLGGYVALFRTVFSCHGVRIGWQASYQITMAGVVATKLFAAAGAGGVALTVWALRASGLSARSVARRVLALEFFLYGVYAGTLVVVGIGLRSGLFPGRAPWTLTVAPAILGGAVIGVLLSMRALPNDFERRMKPLAGARRGRRLLARVASAPWAVHDALGIAFSLMKERNPWLIGAIAYWGFDIATLWACFHAFGSPPAVAVIVMAYFVGTLANSLPLPGGLGGVEAGMVGAFLAFGTHASLAILAVLSYRVISFWLPTLPGAAAYLQLRRTVGVWRDDTKQRKPATSPRKAAASHAIGKV